MTDAPPYARLRLAILAVLAGGVAVAAYVTAPGRQVDEDGGPSSQSQVGQAAEASPSPVHTLGHIEVTARLTEIRGLEKYKGAFPSNDLGYDYAYVLEHRVIEVHRGSVSGDVLFVAHYNPLKPRSQAADEGRPGCELLGGNLDRFRPGDVHRMALEVPVDENYMGPLINPYAGQVDPQLLYWAVWTDRASR